MSQPDKGSAEYKPLWEGSWLFRLIIMLMTVQTMILVAGSPWAMNVSKSVGIIEVRIAAFAPAAELTKYSDYIALLERVVRNEVLLESLK